MNILGEIKRFLFGVKYVVYLRNEKIGEMVSKRKDICLGLSAIYASEIGNIYVKPQPRSLSIRIMLTEFDEIREFKELNYRGSISG